MPEFPVFPKTQRIGILVFNDFEPLDVWGFIQAFAISRYLGKIYSDPPPYPFELVLISNEVSPKTPGAKPKPLRSMNGPSAAPDLFRDQALAQAQDKQFNMLMIPGGKGSIDILRQPDTRELLDWVLAMDKAIPLISSVCTGAAILAKAGLLDGRPAATNHEAFTIVSPFGPAVLWDNVARWVDAGKYITSAGVSAGTDMAFYLVQRMAGRAIAEAAVIAAEYDWKRNPN
jgi:putative intracellular protease/amidase